jgi:hypothetical protein
MTSATALESAPQSLLWPTSMNGGDRGGVTVSGQSGVSSAVIEVEVVDRSDTAPRNAHAPVDKPVRPLPLVDPIPGRCGALRTTDNAYCARYPSKGQRRCPKHGGAIGSPGYLAARRREVEAKASSALVQSGYAPVSAPVNELLDIAGQIVGVKDFLADQVAQLGDLTSIDRAGTENVRAIMSAFERALDRAASVLVSVNKLGLEERRIQIEADKVLIVAEALKRAVWSDTADLDFDQGQAVLRAFAVEHDALVSEQ